MKEKPTFVSTLFGAFPSDLIPKAKNQLMRRKLPQAAITVNYTTDLREIF
jgi:hypothetical protein